MTFKPYRAEEVDRGQLKRRWTRASPSSASRTASASPVFAGQPNIGFAMSRRTPLSSSPPPSPSAAFLETLMAFVIADAGPDVIARIEEFHARRHALGIYRE